MNKKQNNLDKFLDDFSQVDLKKRVRLITSIGIILTIVAIIGTYLFLNTSFQIGVGQPKILFKQMLWKKN